MGKTWCWCQSSAWSLASSSCSSTNACSAAASRESRPTPRFPRPGGSRGRQNQRTIGSDECVQPGAERGAVYITVSLFGSMDTVDKGAGQQPSGVAAVMAKQGPGISANSENIIYAKRPNSRSIRYSSSEHRVPDRYGTTGTHVMGGARERYR